MSIRNFCDCHLKVIAKIFKIPSILILNCATEVFVSNSAKCFLQPQKWKMNDVWGEPCKLFCCMQMKHFCNLCAFIVSQHLIRIPVKFFFLFISHGSKSVSKISCDYSFESVAMLNLKISKWCQEVCAFGCDSNLLHNVYIKSTPFHVKFSVTAKKVLSPAIVSSSVTVPDECVISSVVRSRRTFITRFVFTRIEFSPTLARCLIKVQRLERM